jgi:hypothetical protein
MSSSCLAAVAAAICVHDTCPQGASSPDAKIYRPKPHTALPTCTACTSFASPDASAAASCVHNRSAANTQYPRWQELQASLLTCMVYRSSSLPAVYAVGGSCTIVLCELPHKTANTAARPHCLQFLLVYRCFRCCQLRAQQVAAAPLCSVKHAHVAHLGACTSPAPPTASATASCDRNESHLHAYVLRIHKHRCLPAQLAVRPHLQMLPLLLAVFVTSGSCLSSVAKQLLLHPLPLPAYQKQHTATERLKYRCEALGASEASKLTIENICTAGYCENCSDASEHMCSRWQATPDAAATVNTRHNNLQESSASWTEALRL